MANPWVGSSEPHRKGSLPRAIPTHLEYDPKNTNNKSFADRSRWKNLGDGGITEYNIAGKVPVLNTKDLVLISPVSSPLAIPGVIPEPQCGLNKQKEHTRI